MGQPSLTGLGTGAEMRCSGKAKEELCSARCRGRCWDAIRRDGHILSAVPVQTGPCQERFLHRGAWPAGPGGAEACGHREVCGETASPSQEPVHVHARSSPSDSACAPQIPALALAEVAGLGGETCRRSAPGDLRLPAAPGPAGEGGGCCTGSCSPSSWGTHPCMPPPQGVPRDAC